MNVVGRRVEGVAQRLLQRPLDAVVVDDAADRREDVAALAPERAVLGQVVQLDAALLVAELRLLRGAEHVRPRLAVGQLPDVSFSCSRRARSASGPYVR